MEIHSGKPERWRNQRGTGHVRTRHNTIRNLLGIERLAVQHQLRVEFSRPPTAQHLAHGVLIYTKKVCKWAEIGRERYDCADVEVSVCPAIQAIAYTRSQRVINRSVTDGTGDSNRFQT